MIFQTRGPDEVCLQLKEDAEGLLKQAEKTWDDIAAVGIGAPVSLEKTVTTFLVEELEIVLA